MDVEYHPGFALWLEEVVEMDVEVGGDLLALLGKLEEHGDRLGDPESHPVVTSSMGLRALRRTPSTDSTPYAVGPPVLRVLYGFARPPSRPVRAVVLLGGDKTARGNRWYPPAVAKAESRLAEHTRARGWRIVKLRAGEAWL